MHRDLVAVLPFGGVVDRALDFLTLVLFLLLHLTLELHSSCVNVSTAKCAVLNGS